MSGKAPKPFITNQSPTINMANYYILSGVSGFVLGIYAIHSLFTAKHSQFANQKGIAKGFAKLGPKLR